MAEDSNTKNFLKQIQEAMGPPRPEFPPSDTVHIAPAQRPVGEWNWTGPKYWIAEGYELKKLFGLLCDLDAARIDFANEELARQRYDVGLVPIPRESVVVAKEELFRSYLARQKDMKALIRTALAAKLNLLVTVEARPREVYVVTAPDGPGPKLREAIGRHGFVATTSHGIPAPRGPALTAKEHQERTASIIADAGIALDVISMPNGTISQFCFMLSRGVDRMVMDESGLQGNYNIELDSKGLSKDQFFTLMREELGLQVTPETRGIGTLVVRAK
jgi:uncharacterized protein (TIGR03435 family)